MHKYSLSTHTIYIFVLLLGQIINTTLKRSLLELHIVQFHFPQNVGVDVFLIKSSQINLDSMIQSNLVMRWWLTEDSLSKKSWQWEVQHWPFQHLHEASNSLMGKPWPQPKTLKSSDSHWESNRMHKHFSNVERNITSLIDHTSWQYCADTWFYE